MLARNIPVCFTLKSKLNISVQLIELEGADSNLSRCTKPSCQWALPLILVLRRPLFMLRMWSPGPIYAWIPLNGNAWQCWCFYCPFENSELYRVKLYINTVKLYITFPLLLLFCRLDLERSMLRPLWNIGGVTIANEVTTKFKILGL